MITHILFELRLIMIFSSVANFAQQSLYCSKRSYFRVIIEKVPLNLVLNIKKIRKKTITDQTPGLYCTGMASCRVTHS